MAVKKVSDSMSASLRRIQSDMDRLPAQAHKVWVDVTPKDTGNAKRRTRLVSNKTIVADYNYAVPLDNGHSKQAPRGMSKPTLQFIQGQLRKIMRK